MSAAVSQMEINNPTAGNSKQKQSMNDISGSMGYMSIDGDNENSNRMLNSNSSYMDDYIMACDTKPNSNTNLGSNTNISTSNANISEVLMEGWILRKKSLQV